MKKIFSVLAILTLLTVMVGPLVALAEEPPTTKTAQCTMRHNLTSANWTAKGFKCPAVDATCSFETVVNTCGTCCLMDTIYTVTDWIFVAVFVVAGIMIVYGGFVLATSAGAAEKVTTGRNYILYGGIGVLVALLAKAIPSIIANVLQIG